MQGAIVPLSECKWEPVIIESPYGSSDPIEILRNELYVRAAIRDCLSRGEAPYASHAIYTQRGILNDADPMERRRGMKAGFGVGELFRKRIFCMDRGLSSGMWDGFKEAKRLKQDYLQRRIPGFENEDLFFDFKSIWIEINSNERTEILGWQFDLLRERFPAI